MFKAISSIGRTYQHVQRYSQIISILFRYGFGDLVHRLSLENVVHQGLRLVSRKQHRAFDAMTRGQRLRAMIQELGPTFIKLGQILSTRPDLVPADIIDELAVLQDRVKPTSFDAMSTILEDELGLEFKAYFAKFQEEPLASASIGQVYRAQLETGEEVVVKVQRPNLRKRVELDLEILHDVANFVEKRVLEYESLKPTDFVHEFSEAIHKEVDYTLEASNIERFRRHFEGDERVYIHKVYKHLSTQRVLTLEYIEGVKPISSEALTAAGLDAKQVADRGATLMLEQVFKHRFFHADPHPGNLLILPDGAISYLDFGMMGRLDRTSRELVADLLIAIVDQDEVRAADVLLKLVRAPDDLPLQRIQNDVAEVMDRYLIGTSLDEMALGDLLNHLLKLAAKYRLSMPSDMFLLLKSLAMIEGIGLKLDPDLQMVEKIAPYIRDIKLDRLNPKRITREVLSAGGDLIHLLREIPGEFRQLLRQARRGKAKIEFEHVGLAPLINSNERIANRISSAIVLASMIVGSSLIVLSGIPPTWHEIPVIGIVGYLVSGVMGFSLLMSIRRGH
ncbi:MAG: AarF/ABC1/UbiB kinase family protein [Acidobacteria bacterium]|nr:AarF/ABC1/UbiB kinase family protein [Acidobacteriota bacterium]